jgi:hypothetical protein
MLGQGAWPGRLARAAVIVALVGVVVSAVALVVTVTRPG